jgi:hypothetical protein
METADTPSSTTNKLSNDIVRGAEELSEFVFGNRDRENVRRILLSCRAHEDSDIPPGLNALVRKSAFRHWIANEKLRSGNTES